MSKEGVDWVPHSKVPAEWCEAVIKAVSEVGNREARHAKAIQVSRQWFDEHDRPRYVWGIAIEVDDRLFGDGFRVVA